MFLSPIGQKCILLPFLRHVILLITMNPMAYCLLYIHVYAAVLHTQRFVFLKTAEDRMRPLAIEPRSAELAQSN